MSLSVRLSSSVAVLVAGTFFMENLDGTVIATALPQIARSFHVGPVSLNVGMTAYMLTLAVFIPISGWRPIALQREPCLEARLPSSLSPQFSVE